MEMLQRAIELATIKHSGQVDKQGDPYILHPLRVAVLVDTRDFDKERVKTVAVLHDIVEDTDVSVKSLSYEHDFPAEVVLAVQSVTKMEDGSETYMEFIKRAAGDPIGRLVKMADIKDHLRPGHEEILSKGHIERYIKAYAILASYSG